MGGAGILIRRSRATGARPTMVRDRSSRSRRCAYLRVAQHSATPHNSCGHCGGGEEQEIFGSAGYVSSHYGRAGLYFDQAGRVACTGVRSAADGAGHDQTRGTRSSMPTTNTDKRRRQISGDLHRRPARRSRIFFQQWAAPISDLGFTTVTDAKHTGVDRFTFSFDQVGLPGFPISSGSRATTKNAKRAYESGYVRAAIRRAT